MKQITCWRLKNERCQHACVLETVDMKQSTLMVKRLEAEHTQSSDFPVASKDGNYTGTQVNVGNKNDLT